LKLGLEDESADQSPLISLPGATVLKIRVSRRVFELNASEMATGTLDFSIQL
jgi:hypothetical protein